MKIKNQKDFFAGLRFVALGLGFAWGAWGYGLGTAAQMGPGYLPLRLGLLLAALGALVMFKAGTIEVQGGGRTGPWAWRALLCVLAAPGAFVLLLVGLPGWGLPPMGLVLAVLALVLIASLALPAPERRWGQALALAALLALGSALLSVFLLQLPLALWPAFIRG